MSEGLVVSMYLDEATARVLLPGTSVGINNNAFKGNVVPFAPHSDGEWIALKKFARAHRAGYVRGTPDYLLNITIPDIFALQHFLDQDIKVVEGRPEKTIGFTRIVNENYYPSMKVMVTTIDVSEADKLKMLNAGYGLLNPAS